MSEYLTPEEVGHVAEWACHGKFALPLGRCGIEYAATLREMAAIVGAVAELDASGECCQLCNAQVRWDGSGHKPDCAHLRARKLRGDS